MKLYMHNAPRSMKSLDWLNTNFYRDYGYNLVYPQLFPHHKRRSEEAHAGTIEWGKEKSKRWLANMKQLQHWNAVNATFNGFVDAMKDRSFVTLR
jgi:hypothetical protein